MNKKYLPSALILYLNYFIHGVGCSILGQAVIKEALAASWGVETMAITAIALVVTALLTRKIKDVRFIVIYPVICLVTLVVVLSGQSQPLMIAGAFIIGWAGAGGLLQIATSVCNMLFPKIKGTVTALVMIASSLCNYTILTAASKMAPSQVMLMNIVLTAIGVALGLFVNLRYKKMVELANE